MVEHPLGGNTSFSLLRGDKGLGRPFVAQPTLVSLTFDDGSSDQYCVRSLLARYSMHATFYVNSGTVGSPGIMTGRSSRTWPRTETRSADTPTITSS